MSDLTEIFGEPIYSYTRAQAIEDGMLVDVSEAAKIEGFTYPVALTSAVWESVVAVPEGLKNTDEVGRLHDLLWMLKLACRQTKGDTLYFTVQVLVGERAKRNVKLKSQCHPNDDGSPCITVMLETED